jgi:hypothetical protein
MISRHEPSLRSAGTVSPETNSPLTTRRDYSGSILTLSDERTGLPSVMQSVGGQSRGGLVNIHYCLYWVPFPSPLTTRRD